MDEYADILSEIRTEKGIQKFDQTSLIDTLKRHEGLRLDVYKDSLGYETIGYGHLLKKGEDYKKISKDEAEQLLIKDLNIARKTVESLPKKVLENLDSAKKDVLINMTFNLGATGLSKFKKMFKAIEEKDFDSASAEMLDSLWAKQMGRRSVELSNIMRQKVEVKNKFDTDTDWYDNMISQSKKVGKLILAPSVFEEKPQIHPLLSPVLAAPEITGQLAWGMASWLPSKITGMGTAGLLKLSNAILESEQKGKGRTPEEIKILKEIKPFSPEEIRKKAEQAEAWWQVMPEPATKEAKVVLEKVGKGLDWLLSPFKVADEYYTKKGYPNLGYALRFIGEGLYFKGLHGVKTAATPKLKALRKKLVKKAPVKEIEERLSGILDEMEIVKEPPKGEELKRVTKSQKIKAHKIQREQGLSKAEYMEIAERISGETSIKDMNKAKAKEFIEELKKGKEGLEKAREAEKGEEVKVEEKVEEKEEVVEEAKEIEEVKEEKIEEKIEEVKEEEVKEEIKEKVLEPKPPVKPKPKPEPPSESVKISISDDIRTAEDMGIYTEVKDMIGEGKKIGEIMKEVKQKAYYKEDLKDFGYNESDIRKSIRAIKAEAGEKTAIKSIQDELKKEEIEVEKLKETKTEEVGGVVEPVLKEGIIDVEATEATLPKISKDMVRLYRAESPTVKFEDVFDLKKLTKFAPDRPGDFYTTDLKYADYFRESFGKDATIKYIDISEKVAGRSKIREGEYLIEKVHTPERVDPISGRPAGVKEDLITSPKEIDEVRMRWEQEQMPITSQGKIVKTKSIAKIMAERQGKTGELIKNPKGEGWLLRETKEQRKTRIKEEEKEWEATLKEEELGDIGDEGLGERVDVDVDSFTNILKGERGAITIHRKAVKELKHLIKKGYYTRNRIIKELRNRGASDEDILKVFPDASVRILNKGKESKWWKEGQDPLALLPRRKLPKGRGKAPAITRGEAHMIATMNDLPPSLKFDGSFLGLKCFTTSGTKTHRLTAEHFSLENAIRTFEKLPPEIKETFYRTVKEGESLSHDHLQDVLKRSKEIRNSISYIHHKRIGIYAIAQQPDGIAVLAQQGIVKIPKLKPKELKAYEDLRLIYDELFPLLNKARKASGEKPFPKMKNYFTWIQDLHWLEKNHGIGLFSDVRTIESKMAEIKRVPSFRYAKERAGPDKPRKLNLNPFAVMDVYAKTATSYIEMAPRLAKLNELLTEKYEMKQNAPNAYNFIKHWLNYQAGKIPAWDIANPIVRRALQKLNSNIVYSLLAFNVRSALIQPAALASSYAMLGEYYMAAGIAHMMSPAKWKMAGKKSNVLNTRSPDVALYEAMEASGKFPGMIQKKIGKVGLMPLTALDSVAARITWLGAYEKGLKKLKMSEKNAINYADDIVTKTQASAARSDIAPIQRTQLGKTVTCLQTFVINHWGFLTKDVMGIKNANISNPQTVKRVIRFILATTAVNTFFEDGLHMNSPNPTPIRAYRQVFEDTEDSGEAFIAAVKEIAEYVPIWGGRLRYGSEVGGPAMTETLKLIEKGDVSALTKLMGIPGSNQFFKMVRAYEMGGTDLDILLGRYPELSRDWKSNTKTPAMKSPKSAISF